MELELPVIFAETRWALGDGIGLSFGGFGTGSVRLGRGGVGSEGSGEARGGDRRARGTGDESTVRHDASLLATNPYFFVCLDILFVLLSASFTKAFRGFLLPFGRF